MISQMRIVGMQWQITNINELMKIAADNGFMDRQGVTVDTRFLFQWQLMLLLSCNACSSASL